MKLELTKGLCSARSRLREVCQMSECECVKKGNCTMTIQDRINGAAEILGGEDKREMVVTCLNAMGINEDAAGLDLMTSEDFVFGDARAEFCDKNKVPITVFRRLFKVLHGEDKAEKPETVAVGSLGDDVTDALGKMAASMRTIGSWDDEELLAAYGPDCKPQVVEELYARVGDKTVVAFESDKKSVNVAVTLLMMKQARQRAAMPGHHRDGERTYILYSVGSFPEVVYNVCPVTGELMIDDYSSELGCKWEIELEGRQFIALMANQGIHIDSLNVAQIQTIYKDEGITGLENKFPKVAPIFEDLKETGRLPALKSKDIKGDTRKVEKPFQTRVNYKAKRH